MNKNITTYLNSYNFNYTDIYLARFVDAFTPESQPEVALAAALVSRAGAGGHACIALPHWAGTMLPSDQRDAPALHCPDIATWQQRLRNHPAVGRPGQFRPLVLDDAGRLYLYRFWRYERHLCTLLRQRAAEVRGVPDDGRLKQLCASLLPPAYDPANEQQRALTTAACRNLCVVAGGPGTGKTYVVARILALVHALQEKDRQLQAALVAPTGKAAARLAEALRRAKAGFAGRDPVWTAVPTQTATVHRLLKPIPGTTRFRHNRRNPLPVDIVVVDEASMVDLALMVKLVEAVPPDARLIFLGDPEQLASVEAGSVLSDLCGRKVRAEAPDGRRPDSRGRPSVGMDAPRSPHSPLAACIVFLKRNFRFDQASGIGGLSERIRRGDAEGACTLLRDPGETDLCWEQAAQTGPLLEFIRAQIESEYGQCLYAADPLEALQYYSRFQTLCVVNGGPLGVAAVNRLAERLWLEKAGLRRSSGGSGSWFKGRPILITQNDYDLGLFNGDIGITWTDIEADTDRLYVYFPDDAGGLRRFGLQRLPPHAPAFAISVHKAQGSEFDKILLVLPEKDYPVLHRELLYTAVTRSRRYFSLAGPERIWRLALKRSGERGSGLSECLWDPI